MRPALVLLLALAVQDNKERDAMLKIPLDAMEKAVRGSDEKLFKEHWHAEGYAKNLVGGSGLPGTEVYKDGARKKWYLKADLSKASSLGGGRAVIVPCDIWSWEKEKSLDKVDLVLVKAGDKDKPVYVVLGGGEKSTEVAALADRFLKGEPLEPPKEKEEKK